MKIIIIANRLPVKVLRIEDQFSIERSEGGLATGLGSLETEAEKYWVGWPGIFTDDDVEKKRLPISCMQCSFTPFFIG